MTSHKADIDGEKEPNHQNLEFRRILVYLALPTIVLLGFAAGPPSTLKVASFGFFVVAYSYLYPWLLLSQQPKESEILPSKSVDFVYYSLGIMGTCLFFVANNVSPSEFLNRNSAADAYRDQAFYAWFKPEKVFTQQRYLDALKSGLLQQFQHYVNEQDKRVDECAPQNFDRYDFCEVEKNQYRTAREHIDRGYVSVRRSGSRSSRRLSSARISRAILESRRPNGIPINIEHKRFGSKRIVFNPTTLFDYHFLREPGAKLKVDDAFSRDFLPLIESNQSQIEYLEDEFLEIKKFQSISGFSYSLGNFWPFILCLALSMKIGRTRYRFS